MSIEQNIENLEIRNANVVTFVGSSSTIVDTISGRIQCKGFQHNSNVITDISGPHGRIAPTLKKYPEIEFEYGKLEANETTFTYTQAGYTVKGTNSNTGQTSGPGPGRTPWKAFSDLNDGGQWQPTGFSHDTGNNGSADNVAAAPVFGPDNTKGAWIRLELPKKIKLQSVYVNSPGTNNERVGIGKLYGSNNNSDWVTIKDDYTLTYSGSNANDTVNSAVAYKYIVFQVRATGGGAQLQVNKIRYYGYEEDPPAGDHSVDTTFKSRFNNPQLTGVQVFVDGKGSGSNQIAGGPTVTDVATTYNEPGKYWELTGELTSNIAVEANTFLEGDQPHAVSVWFNSSNLEANVSNTCVFSVSDQEKLDSVNLDLQSNTWHNLTYAYQGEGGSKVTYLDGRKVAEDQAEDTFGEYPPFDMTGYSQGGYVVSATNFTSTYYPWTAFDGRRGNVGEGWFTDGGLYTIGGDGAATSSATEFPVGTGRRGEYLDLEMPHKLKVSYFVIQTRDTSHAKIPEDSPHEGYLYGSNDGINWTEIKFFSGLTYGGAGVNSATEDTVTVNSTTAYKHLRLQATKRGGAHGSDSYVGIGELKYYGHRENDLVRLPDPTNVLKYPHVTVTGPAQRGYALEVSSSHQSTSFAGYQAELKGYLFDDDSTTYWHCNTNGTSDHHYNGNNSSYGTNSVANFDPTGINVKGEWIQLEFPHKLKISKVHLLARSGQEAQAPEDFAFYGSDTGSAGSWTLIQAFTGESPQDDGSSYYDITSNPAPYKYILMLMTRLVSSTGAVSLAGLRYYGTGVDSVPIQIGGGNIDKVANFRVYDKFIGEDQALEIWDAQKEEFGRAKPQMVLQQGKLGIGTDAPQGSLSVADEPDPTTYGLQEFPPRAMTDYETYMEGHGEFCASAGGGEYTRTGNGSAFSAFDKNEEEWQTHGGTFSSGALAGIGLTTITNGIGAGPWVQLELPYKILLKRWAIQARTGQQSRHLKSAILVGSNDGNTWDTIQTVTNQPSQTTLQYRYYDVSGNNKYHKYLRLVITEVNGGDRSEVNELRYFGYREQVTKQSVLHDGQLTLTKNLTVPRIGPAFVEYPTPRQDKIHLQYDTSLSIHDDTHIMDTSGRSIDLSRQGDGYYNSGTESLHFDGNDSYYNTTIGDWSDNQHHTHSLWLKTTANSGNPVVLWNAVNNNDDYSGISVNAGSHFSFWHFGNDHNYNYNVQKHVWYHVVAVYNGNSGTQKMYINGEEIPVTTIGTINSLSMGTNPKISLGGDQGRNAYYFTGEISKYRLHSVALTPEEVFTLYKQGRTTPVHHLQLVDSTMTIGSHNRHRDAQLDVAGHIRAGSAPMHTFTGQHRCFPDEPVEKGLIVSAKKNQFVKLNGFATGQDAITIDESLPIVSLSNVVQDKACFGVVSSIEKSTPRRSQIMNGIISDAKKEKGDNRAIVNSVGEGAIWVVDTGGALESGDYITTSNVAGYGQKQDGAGLMNYTVAKITMDCDFTASNVAVQTIKREETGTRTITEDAWNQLVDYDRSSNTETQYSNTLVSSAYTDQPGYVPREVTTIVDYTDGSNLISVAEWSDLESNIQNTYQSNTFTEIVDYTKFVNLSEWSNLTAETQATYSEAEITTYYQIQRGGNVLDENGQLQFEDKTGATEAPYEKRFLTVDGTQTDEANAVHIAAFVGCTYHCG